MTHAVTRRTLLGGISAASLWLATAPASFALSVEKSTTLVTALVADINRVIESGKSERAMYGDFQRIFATYADVPTIARYALGVEARSASPAQLKQFTAAFETYIARKYGSQFRQFIGGRIEVDSAKQVKSFIEVKTTAHMRGEAPFEVKFLVSDKSGKHLFFNMFVEGINMLLTERTEIGSMIDANRGDLNKTIAQLKSLS
ncbi:phospholipid-binding protein MlaC [Falsihalocynthiibacter sp. SS001]|uniref:MlaC/ttg2D family ABC transporter substrate-binding protein n=1 Tax=Falsihalocynthiibacter sp. SS001 TaxID=3349698 RepID=UPI0036D41491